VIILNSNAFISKYLNEHGYTQNIIKRRLVLGMIFVIIASLAFTHFNPLYSMRAQAIQNFKNYDTSLKKQVKQFSTFAKDNSLYDLPIDNAKITSNYGMRTDPITGQYVKHTGIDMAATNRAPVHTIEAGIVTFAGYQQGYGNCIEISHAIAGKPFYTFYAHLSSIDVKVEELVKARQVIGKEGGDPNTDPSPGYSTGHHLHFEVRNNSGYGNDVNPKNYLKL
jgi:murein DD-endopeptidase MepM/ murein hydrolase activator NlpD